MRARGARRWGSLGRNITLTLDASIAASCGERLGGTLPTDTPLDKSPTWAEVWREVCHARPLGRGIYIAMMVCRDDLTGKGCEE